jgi:DNA gyrase subunit B
MAKDQSGYDASAIQVLEGLEPVRKRPGMYIGGTGSDGFHHLIWEIVDNAIDEAMAGHATKIVVVLFKDKRTVAVLDDGRGIPVDQHANGMSALDVVFTILHAGGKFQPKNYKFSGGLHGVGASVTNALSESLVVEVRRNGKVYRREYSRGIPQGEISTTPSTELGTGTSVTWTPDPEIFGTVRLNPDVVHTRLELKSYLSPGCIIEVIDEISGTTSTYCSQNGLADLVQKTFTSATTPLFSFTATSENMRVDLAFGWTDNTTEDIQSFANGIYTRDGGTHLIGVRDCIIDLVRSIIEAKKIKLPKGWKITREDILEGVTGALHVLVREPQFQGQTKDRLNNPEVRKAVAKLLEPELLPWLTTHQDAILDRVQQATRAREASRTAGAAVRRAGPLGRIKLPGKLADCSSTDAAETELFLVEGDSAGGSAKQGRDRKTQAILALRGKVINVEKLDLAGVEANREIKAIIDAIGCGIGPSFSRHRLRYGKIICLADADVDGAHITALLMTFFYRFLPALIEDGCIYLACPPLFSVQTPNGPRYAKDEEELRKLTAKFPKAQVMRFKGLGEMNPETLFTTTMNPKTRRLLQLTIPIGKQLAVDAMFQDLMGENPATRLMHLESVQASLDI